MYVFGLVTRAAQRDDGTGTYSAWPSPVYASACWLRWVERAERGRRAVVEKSEDTLTDSKTLSEGQASTFSLTRQSRWRINGYVSNAPSPRFALRRQRLLSQLTSAPLASFHTPHTMGIYSLKPVLHSFASATPLPLFISTDWTQAPRPELELEA